MRSLTVLGALVLALVACTRVPALPWQRERLAQGREVFVRHGCHGCHTIRAMGTPIAPDLSDIGARRSTAWLERWLRDPAAQQPLAHMPPIAMPADEAEALAAWLATMR